MKNSVKNSGRKFGQLRTKLFLRTTGLLAVSAGAVHITYNFLLKGNFANIVIWMIQNISGEEYDTAFEIYRKIFRSHMDGILLFSILLIFIIIFQIYLKWFVRYFEEINKSLDKILGGVPGEITLSPELRETERRLSELKHTTERQRSEMELTEQRKSDLIMYLAHDLKTPLATAVSYLTLLRDEGEIPEGLRRKYTGIALTKAERIEDMVNEFLEIAKMKLSVIEMQYSEIDLERLIEQTANEMKPFVAEKSIECSITSTGEDNRLKCDADKIQRVFENLLRNAVLYSAPGTEITVRLERGEGRMEVKISNHGATIPAEKLERIFEQFYRLDAGRNTNGTGLGLAIAKQIITLHGGTLTAASADGVTIFTVILPVL